MKDLDELERLAADWRKAQPTDRAVAYIADDLAAGVTALLARVRALEGERRDWTSLTNEERLAFLEAHPCCRHCGSLDTSCQCWNDE